MSNPILTLQKFEEFCEKERTVPYSKEEWNGIALIGIDRYTKVRSRIGFTKTEELTEKLGEQLSTFASDNVIISRFADGIFIMALHHLKNREEMTALCESIHQSVKLQDPNRNPVTVSMCVVRCYHEGYRCYADKALRGLEEDSEEGNRIIYFDEPERREKVRVMVVEDQELPRQLFESYIRSSAKYELAYSIRNADAAYFYASQGNVDLILMDVVTDRGANGLEASERIKKAFPKIKIIVVTSMPEVTYLERAREVGVDSFWYKEVDETPILKIMDRTMAGESIYPDNTPEVILGTASSYEFTDRELSILRELMSGASNQEIGKKLYLSPATVKYHIANMLTKTGYKSRTELAVRVRESGLIIPDRTDES